MLRVLDASGVLIIMSTMPPDIFAKVALSHTNLACVPVIERSSDSDKLDCVRYTKLQTAEGGAIFYYAICKRLYAVESAKKESAMDVMDGIRALLNQAKEARSQLDDAAAKVLTKYRFNHILTVPIQRFYFSSITLL